MRVYGNKTQQKRGEQTNELYRDGGNNERCF